MFQAWTFHNESHIIFYFFLYKWKSYYIMKSKYKFMLASIWNTKKNPQNKKTNLVFGKGVDIFFFLRIAFAFYALLQSLAFWPMKCWRFENESIGLGCQNEILLNCKIKWVKDNWAKVKQIIGSSFRFFLYIPPIK